jgi:hypothetical protein
MHSVIPLSDLSFYHFRSGAPCPMSKNFWNSVPTN